MTTRKKFKIVNQYIHSFPTSVQAILQKIRSTIRKAAPKAEETISYQIPAFKLNGKSVAYFAAFKHHIGFYPPAPRAFKKEVAQYAGPKGNLRFPLDQPMPLGLVKRIVAYHVKEIGKKEE